MKRQLLAVASALTLIGSPVALAHKGAGGAGGAGMKQELSGRVVKATHSSIYVELSPKEGGSVVVPLSVNKDTKFETPGVRKSSDLKEGERVRAQLEREKTKNLATRVWRETGIGGAGSAVPPSPSPSESTMPPSGKY